MDCHILFETLMFESVESHLKNNRHKYLLGGAIASGIIGQRLYQMANGDDIAAGNISNSDGFNNTPVAGKYVDRLKNEAATKRNFGLGLNALGIGLVGKSAYDYRKQNKT